MTPFNQMDWKWLESHLFYKQRIWNSFCSLEKMIHLCGEQGILFSLLEKSLLVSKMYLFEFTHAYWLLAMRFKISLAQTSRQIDVIISLDTLRFCVCPLTGNKSKPIRHRERNVLVTASNSAKILIYRWFEVNFGFLSRSKFDSLALECTYHLLPVGRPPGYTRRPKVNPGGMVQLWHFLFPREGGEL